MKSSETLTMNDLVDALAQEFFHGTLPPFPEVIASAVIQSVPCLREAGQVETQRFADTLILAIRDHLDAQRAAENAEFLS